MIYNSKMTAEEIIKKSVQDVKYQNQKKRQVWVRRVLDYYGGNGTGVIISVRPRCLDGQAIAALDRIQIATVSDGTSNTFLIGEKFVPSSQLKQYPFDVPAYDGDHLPASCRLAGPGLRLATSPDDVMADMFSFGSWHPGGVHFAMVDGSIRFLNSRTDTKILGTLANRHDAQIAELTP